jgi:hypothetical protein
MGADAHKKSFETIFPQLGDGEVFADFHPGFELNPQVFDGLDFGFDNIPGKPVGWNTDGQHAAQHRQLFENRYPIAFDGQIIGGGQTRRAGTNDGDFFVSGFLGFGNESGTAL